MPKFTKIFVFLLFVVPFITFAQTGKIVGKVTDLETGEPLIGANVIIQGTSQGAATDENGEYLILNVYPSTYTIQARYIGYRDITLQNIRVSVNLTTEANFQLPSETYTTDVVTVIAPRPLVNKNITNSTEIVNKEDIENLPIRGVNAIVATQAGVVQQGGNLHFRGSRQDAVAFYVDGVMVNNPVFGGSRTAIINNAIEEIQVQSGGYSAEFGGANGGIISSQTRAGTEKYQISLEAITDNFTNGVGKEFLGGYTYGYSEYVLTASGPILPSYQNLKFFLAANNVFTRSGAAFFGDYNFEDLPDAVRDAEGNQRPDFDIKYPKGYTPNNGSNTYQFQGNLTYDLNPFTFRVNANYRTNENRGGIGWNTYDAVNSASLNQDYSLIGSFKFTHVINPSSFYDVIFSVFDDYYVTMDPYFKDQIWMYGDSLSNAAIGRYMEADGISPDNRLTYGTFQSLYGDQPVSAFRKQASSNIGGKVNFLYQLGKHHEFKTGGEFTKWTIRRYSISNGRAIAIAQSVNSNPDGEVTDWYTRVDNYGYDSYGNLSDADEASGAKHPIFAGFYINDKMEFTDLVVNVGFRLDYINTDSKTFSNPTSVAFDQITGNIDESALVDVDPILQVVPRLGLSFPVTDKTMFHAQYGKFIQQSQLRDIYLGYNATSDIVKGGYAELNPVGFGLRPERTTSYEIGFRQQLGENFAFDITGFYKDIKDQIQARQIYADASAQHSAYYALVNGDFATTKGFELKLDLRRIERIALTFDYTYSDAQGTGSTPNEATRTIWQSPTQTPFFPVQISPLSFNQTHHGAFNMDYRFADDDGPEIFGSRMLSNLGMNLLFTFNSGFNFTRFAGYTNSRIPTEGINESTTPWNFQLDARINKSFDIGQFNFDIYLWVINVLNTQNIVGVFNQTGDAEDDGWLSTEEGQNQIENYRNQYGDEGAETYKQLYLASIYNAGNYGTPRQIRLGIRINY
ncbi:MAG: TonB-dependent receptor [bacterium]